MMQFLCKFATSVVALAKAGCILRSFSTFTKVTVDEVGRWDISLHNTAYPVNFNSIILLKNYVSNNTGSVNYRRNR
jgi:hypothetical protein